VTVAAEIVLDRALPAILDGTVKPVEQDLSKGSYFGGRKPEDGRIDWTRARPKSTTSCARWRRPTRARSANGAEGASA
jgi:methionyl-tRNA formyltransferase